MAPSVDDRIAWARGSIRQIFVYWEPRVAMFDRVMRANLDDLGVDLMHFFVDMRAVMEFWRRFDLLSALPKPCSKTQLNKALDASSRAEDLPDFVRKRLSDKRNNNSPTVRNIGAHHYIMAVSVGHPEVKDVEELVCWELEELEGMPSGKSKKLMVRVEATLAAVKDAAREAGFAVA